MSAEKEQQIIHYPVPNIIWAYLFDRINKEAYGSVLPQYPTGTAKIM